MTFNENLEWRAIKEPEDDPIIYEGKVQTILERDVDFRTQDGVYEAYISENELEKINKSL
ncbi:MAG: hypothetical protein K6B14_00995 [Lachnospiraceae bacterium]|nr:hypothetical protein [Lachnospiraceae bacterium]